MIPVKKGVDARRLGEDAPRGITVERGDSGSLALIVIGGDRVVSDFLH